MNLPKNIQFTQLVKCEGKQREFNFLRRNAAGSPFYHVDTSDLQGNRYQFNMDRGTEGWKIRDRALPVWILEVESLLADLIDEQEG
jgi:hypothetical protein